MKIEERKKEILKKLWTLLSWITKEEKNLILKNVKKSSYLETERYLYFFKNLKKENEKNK